MLITGKPFQFCTWNIARNLCSGWGGAACRTECMLHEIVIMENVMTFATAVPISVTSFVYLTNVYWSVIHGIKRKPHLSVVWNWYHFVAIAILHQSRPTDSADINTRLQLSDTSSIPPMHGGFFLVPMGTGGNGGEEVMRRLTYDQSFYFLNNHLGDLKSEEEQVGKPKNKFFETYVFIIC